MTSPQTPRRQPIRVLHVIVGLGAGGAESMLANLVARMDRARFEPLVVSVTDFGVRGAVIERSGVRVIALGIRPGAPDPRAVVRLRRVIREFRPHIVQSWMYHADLLAIVAARGMHVPVLWNIRCSNVDLARTSFVTRLTIRAAARLSPRPAGAVVNSNCGREVHDSLGFHVRQWHLIPNGIDTQRFRPDAAARVRVRKELGISEETPVVGLLARFDPMKDHATFFAAAAEIARRTDAHFVLAGTGITTDNAALTRLITAPELIGRVHLLGYRGDTEELMAALDVHVLSSSSAEGFPNVVGEAMAAGAICVSTDIGDARTIIGDTGAVVPIGDAPALAAAVIEILTCGLSRREELRRAARERIVSRFSIDTAVARYEYLYETIVARTV